MRYRAYHCVVQARAALSASWRVSQAAWLPKHSGRCAVDCRCFFFLHLGQPCDVCQTSVYSWCTTQIHGPGTDGCVRACLCVCLRARVRASAPVRARARVCVCACVRLHIVWRHQPRSPR